MSHRGMPISGQIGFLVAERTGGQVVEATGVARLVTALELCPTPGTSGKMTTRRGTERDGGDALGEQVDWRSRPVCSRHG